MIIGKREVCVRASSSNELAHPDYKWWGYLELSTSVDDSVWFRLYVLGWCLEVYRPET